MADDQQGLTEDDRDAQETHAAVSGAALAAELSKWTIFAFAILLVFTCTMTFEFGIATYWHIPLDLLSFSAVNAFEVLLALLIVGVIVLFAINAADDHPSLRVTLPWAVLTLFLLLMAMGIVRFEGMVVIVFGLGIAYVIWALLPYLSLKKYDQEKSIGRAAREMLGIEGMLLSGMLVGLPLIAAVVGFATGSREQSYLVLDTTPEMVVLRSYGDKLVMSELKRAPGGKGGTVGRRFRVIVIGDDESLLLHSEDLRIVGVSQAAFEAFAASGD